MNRDKSISPSPEELSREQRLILDIASKNSLFKLADLAVALSSDEEKALDALEFLIQKGIVNGKYLESSKMLYFSGINQEYAPIEHKDVNPGEPQLGEVIQCQHCGAEVLSGGNYCDRCGTRTEGSKERPLRDDELEPEVIEGIKEGHSEETKKSKMKTEKEDHGEEFALRDDRMLEMERTLFYEMQKNLHAGGRDIIMECPECHGSGKCRCGGIGKADGVDKVAYQFGRYSQLKREGKSFDEISKHVKEELKGLTKCSCKGSGKCPLCDGKGTLTREDSAMSR